MQLTEKITLAEQHRNDICVEYYIELHIWCSIVAMANWYQMKVDTLRQIIAEGDKIHQSKKHISIS